jgi:outer membrane protein assembly factor BamA
VVRIALTCLLLLVLTGPTPGFAQKDTQKDNTGTNPANFTYDFRLIAEMAELDDPGGSALTTTFEFRWPLGRDVANLRGDESGSLFYDMGKKFGARIRARYKNLSVDTPGVAPFGASEVSGIGDFDARVLYMAYASKKLIVVPGLEAFFDTASNDALGSGKTSLGPVIFAVFPGILGGSSLFAPGYQYIFDIAGDDSRSDISRSQIDLYFVWLLSKGKNWLIVDPQKTARNWGPSRLSGAS